MPYENWTQSISATSPEDSLDVVPNGTKNLGASVNPWQWLFARFVDLLDNVVTQNPNNNATAQIVRKQPAAAQDSTYRTILRLGNLTDEQTNEARGDFLRCDFQAHGGSAETKLRIARKGAICDGNNGKVSITAANWSSMIDSDSIVSVTGVDTTVSGISPVFGPGAFTRDGVFYVVQAIIAAVATTGIITFKVFIINTSDGTWTPAYDFGAPQEGDEPEAYYFFWSFRATDVALP